MKTSAYAWPSAALLLLTLGGRTALADTGFAYAWISDGALATVSSVYSLNPGGGAVTASRASAGVYTVVFPNSEIGPEWSVQATAYGANANYCNVASWGGSGVSVNCYNASGAAADSPFTVLAVSTTNDKDIAFAWANQSTTASYTPSTSYSYNPSGAISVTRSSPGSYAVTFNGLNGSGGTVQVDAYNSNATCYSGGWGGSFQASVNCVDTSGNFVDSQFVIFIVPASVSPTGIAFAWADGPSSATYTPSTSYSYNPTGGGVNITRSSTGQYTVTFSGLNAALLSGGDVRATSYGSTARCKVTEWGSGPGNTLQVGVGCYNLTGGAVDAEYEVLALPAMGYAYAYIYDGTTASVSSSFSVNPGGAPVTAVHNGTGSYTVTFPNSGIGSGWAAQAMAYGATADYCATGGWGNNAVTVLCYTTAGAAADSEFTVSAVSTTNGQNIAFAWANEPTSTSTYTPDTFYSYNPAGTIAVTRFSTGNYEVVFNGLSGAGGTVQVTAYAAGGINCYSDGWSGANFTASVDCQNAGGTATDSDFVIAVIPIGTTPPQVAYAWADQPTVANYTPDTTYSYNPGGAVSVNRSGAGQYAMTFSGLNAAQVTGGDVRVTAYATTTRCKVTSWTSATINMVAYVACYDPSGTLTDAEYQVLVFAPALGSPGAVTLSGGSPQSTPATTAFATALSAKVTDGNGNPISNVTVTFAAPSSGASGTFPGSSLTATAATDASGVATAPTFTANSTVGGPYNVTASVLGVSGTAKFALTNTALTAVTLTTSPGGLLVSLDGGPFVAAPYTVNLVPSSTHTIATETPQAGAAGVQYVWQNWSDSGAISHNISVPGSAWTFTATFQTQYELTISALPPAGGVVTPASGLFYNAASVVPVAATAASGYIFNGWTGPVASPSSASTTVTMSAPETVTANFNGPTSITIQTSPAGLQFSVDGGAAQTAPKTLSLSETTHTIAVVTPQSGTPGTQYVFTGWSDGGAASHSITVTGSAATYTASFQTQYQLTISGSPVAGGSVTPTSGAFYNAGTVVPVTAIANSGYSFSSWSGSVASSSSASTTVTMSSPETVTANFSSLTGITIQTNPPGLQVSVDGVTYTAPQTLNLAAGPHTIAVVTTQGGGGTQDVFSGWSDGGAASHSISVTGSPATYTATFTVQYLLTTAASPAGSGSVAANPASAGYYTAGASVQLTASASAGYQFSNWSGDVSGSANPQSITMNAPHSVTANFITVVSSCSFVLGPSSASLPATGTSTVETCPNGSGQPNCGVLPETARTFTVTPSATCGAWTATSSDPGILQVTSGATGSGTGAVGYTLLTNTHTTPQTYTILVAGGGTSATYTISEAGSGDSEVYRQVYALYEQLLGRDPDSGGFAFWTGTGGAGLGQMADAFLTSPEAFNSDFVVMATYQAATGAPPTFAQYSSTVVGIREGTLTVTELFNSLTPAGYSATTLYQNLLNRLPSATEINDADSAGLATWFQTLIGYPNSTTPVNTPNNEFQSTGIYNTGLSADHTNALYTRMLYFVILGRDPDVSGFNFWVGVANSGGPGVLFSGSAGVSTRIQILGPGTAGQGFIGSPEFQNLFAN